MYLWRQDFVAVNSALQFYRRMYLSLVYNQLSVARDGPQFSRPSLRVFSS